MNSIADHKVAIAQVKHWLVMDGNDNKYEDSVSKLTDLLNEAWTHGNTDTMPTMKELREDILELWESRGE